MNCRKLDGETESVRDRERAREPLIIYDVASVTIREAVGGHSMHNLAE